MFLTHTVHTVSSRFHYHSLPNRLLDTSDSKSVLSLRFERDNPCNTTIVDQDRNTIYSVATDFENPNKPVTRVHDDLNAVDFCKQYFVSHRPSFLLLHFRVVDIHRLPGDGVTGFHARRKPVIVRAWPRASSIPARHDPAFEHWAIAQLRLYKPHRSIQELSAPSVDAVFSEHLARGGFPNLLQLSTAEETEADSDEVPDDTEDNLLRTAPLETDLVQDDYQVLMDIARLPCESTQLLV